MAGTKCALPGNVGILGIEFYFPRNYVAQERLEEYMKQSKGKFTIGFGQTEMSFCGDNEDANSMALTVTQSLLENYKIDPSDIGYMVVGSESETDKSKSIKTYLMDLFKESGNFDVGGVDVKNACYGGTAALEACINWVRTNDFKNKKAIAVMSDVAVYEEGNARPTGGAGAIAILVGPEAPITFCRATGFDMRNSNDFYKPLKPMNTEYPMVNGQTSLSAYMSALDNCYRIFKKEMKEYCKEEVSVSTYDSVAFHCPFAKLVQKAFGRLLLTDYFNENYQVNGMEIEKYKIEELMDVNRYLKDRDFMSLWLRLTEEDWNKKTLSNLTFNKRIGNMYTPSLYAQLVALLTRLPEQFDEHRMLLFSYGSGSASAMISFTIAPGPALEQMRRSAQNALERLERRVEFTPEDYTAILRTREVMISKEAPKEPNPEWLPRLKSFSGTYFLKSIDDKYCRTYERRLEDVALQNGHH
uniref:Hydroxymethylglutaryl-CoA synthase n=1 Tax=Steinernema glaseri TaxID=37863 RepID=A0A1I7YRB2_9BILA